MEVKIAVENFEAAVFLEGQAMREFPFWTVTPTAEMGSFGCGCASLSRSATFAQDDNASL